MIISIDRHAYILGQTAGALWFTTMKPGVDNPEPSCPFFPGEEADAWHIGFYEGSEQARDACERL